jgi:uncharacterized membrane protein
MHKQITDPENRTSIRRRKLLVTFAVLAVAGVWLSLTPQGLLGKVDAIGYAVCHRIDLRSFHLGDRPLPLCARCTGMYLGALATLLFFTSTAGRSGLYPGKGIIALLVVAAGIWAFDGLNSFATLVPGAPHLYEPFNTLRLITGSMIGVGLMTMLYPPFQQLAWRRWEEKRVIPGWKRFASLALIVALVDLLVLTEQPLLLYPLAILSGVGVLLLLTMAYTLITLQILKRESAADSLAELTVPIVMGLGLALLQVAGIDLLRFAATGTWSGFHI